MNRFWAEDPEAAKKRYETRSYFIMVETLHSVLSHETVTVMDATVTLQRQRSRIQRMSDVRLVLVMYREHSKEVESVAEHAKRLAAHADVVGTMKVEKMTYKHFIRSVFLRSDFPLSTADGSVTLLRKLCTKRRHMDDDIGSVTVHHTGEGLLQVRLPAPTMRITSMGDSMTVFASNPLNLPPCVTQSLLSHGSFEVSIDALGHTLKSSARNTKTVKVDAKRVSLVTLMNNGFVVGRCASATRTQFL